MIEDLVMRNTDKSGNWANLRVGRKGDADAFTIPIGWFQYDEIGLSGLNTFKNISWKVGQVPQFKSWEEILGTELSLGKKKIRLNALLCDKLGEIYKPRCLVKYIPKEINDDKLSTAQFADYIDRKPVIDEDDVKNSVFASDQQKYRKKLHFERSSIVFTKVYNLLTGKNLDFDTILKGMQKSSVAGEHFKALLKEVKRRIVDKCDEVKSSRSPEFALTKEKYKLRIKNKREEMEQARLHWKKLSKELESMIAERDALLEKYDPNYEATKTDEDKFWGKLKVDTVDVEEAIKTSKDPTIAESQMADDLGF